jgi:hypothetical protein
VHDWPASQPCPSVPCREPVPPGKIHGLRSSAGGVASV